MTKPKEFTFQNSVVALKRAVWFLKDKTKEDLSLGGLVGFLGQQDGLDVG